MRAPLPKRRLLLALALCLALIAAVPAGAANSQ